MFVVGVALGVDCLLVAGFFVLAEALFDTEEGEEEEEEDNDDDEEVEVDELTEVLMLGLVLRGE